MALSKAQQEVIFGDLADDRDDQLWVYGNAQTIKTLIKKGLCNPSPNYGSMQGLASLSPEGVALRRTKVAEEGPLAPPARKPPPAQWKDHTFHEQRATELLIAAFGKVTVVDPARIPVFRPPPHWVRFHRCPNCETRFTIDTYERCSFCGFRQEAA